jgi:hypothetical protein
MGADLSDRVMAKRPAAQYYLSGGLYVNCYALWDLRYAAQREV